MVSDARQAQIVFQMFPIHGSKKIRPALRVLIGVAHGQVNDAILRRFAFRGKSPGDIHPHSPLAIETDLHGRKGGTGRHGQFGGAHETACGARRTPHRDGLLPLKAVRRKILGTEFPMRPAWGMTKIPPARRLCL